MRTSHLLAAACAFCASCAATVPQERNWSSVAPEFDRRQHMVAQGWLGVSEFQSNDFDSDPELPVIGGVFQQPLSMGERARVGIEGGVSFEWEGDVQAVSAGGGGLAIATENDIFLGELLGGPYVELMLGRNMRLYAATGLTLQYALVDVEFKSAAIDSTEEGGFGGGLYGRAGVEWILAGGASFGFGLRYIDSTVDLGSVIGEYDFERVQWLFTLTRNI